MVLLGRQVLSDDTGDSISDECIEQLIGCLSECSNAHTECRKRSTPDWTPTRLIDLNRLKTTGAVQLVSCDDIEPAQPGTQLHYTTLSHIWGSQKFLTLSASNMQELRAGFVVSRLPKTFQEAIAVTAEVGLRYIWIDSLWFVILTHSQKYVIEPSVASSKIRMKIGVSKPAAWTRSVRYSWSRAAS
jgi:hypothetical protein